MYVWMYYVCMYVCMYYVCMYVCMYAYTCMYMYVCMYLYVYILCMGIMFVCMLYIGLTSTYCICLYDVLCIYNMFFPAVALIQLSHELSHELSQEFSHELSHAIRLSHAGPDLHVLYLCVYYINTLNPKP